MDNNTLYWIKAITNLVITLEAVLYFIIVIRLRKLLLKRTKPIVYLSLIIVLVIGMYTLFRIIVPSSTDIYTVMVNRTIVMLLMGIPSWLIMSLTIDPRCYDCKIRRDTDARF